MRLLYAMAIALVAWVAAFLWWAESVAWDCGVVCSTSQTLAGSSLSALTVLIVLLCLYAGGRRLYRRLRA